MERFWNKVDQSSGPDSCWPWVGGTKDKQGYGRIEVNRKKIRAHRLSWQLTRGGIPHGLCVLHRCDNPPCVNPDHPFLGTNRDNVHDCIRKGRFSAPIKLNADKVREIRALSRQGLGFNAIAKRYGVDRGTVRDVVVLRNWRHVG